MESHYNVNCDSATRKGLLDFQGLREFVDVTYRQLEDVCHPGRFDKSYFIDFKVSLMRLSY